MAPVAKGPYGASAININYSDSGLFGFYVVGQPEDMDGILKTCAATFGNATKVTAFIIISILAVSRLQLH